jgi:tRNA threonylcarbamoyladenosine biosynthesis protein TsaE
VPVNQILTTREQKETEAAGARLGATLPAGSTVLLYGDLGAGKTTFVRGLARGLGLDPGEVSSPTFVLIQEYRGLRTLYHVDLYRLTGSAVNDLGLEELYDSKGVVVIEWAERLTESMPGAIAVRISDRGGDIREITIDAP